MLSTACSVDAIVATPAIVGRSSECLNAGLAVTFGLSESVVAYSEFKIRSGFQVSAKYMQEEAGRRIEAKP